ncbi:hypothetical protein GOODEAATRI_017916 [Goodea atripinnis]|uniref:Uncharacterized protein n=1 Tax=Goodea atripinnis TaxID=208336 RepID=A0ABV0NVQ0_9TELE
MWVELRLRPLVVITPSVFLSLFLEMLQFCLIHHLLHQVLLPPHAITQILWDVRNEVRYEGLDAEHQVLKKASKLVSTERNYKVRLQVFAAYFKVQIYSALQK